MPLSQSGGGRLLVHPRYVLVQVGQDAEPVLGVDGVGLAGVREEFNGREVPAGMDPVEPKCDSTVSGISIVRHHPSDCDLGLAQGGVVRLLLALLTGGGVSLAVLLPSSSASIPVFLSSTVVAVLLS